MLGEPVEWPTRTLGEVVEVLDHLRVPVNSDERAKRLGDVPYYGANGQQGWIDCPLFNEDLVLLAEDGGNFDEFATRPIAYRVTGPSWVNNHAHIVRAGDEMSQSFLFWALVNRDIRRYISGGTRSKLTQGELRAVELDLPPLPEQRRIAEILDTLDEAIRKTEQVIKKLQQMKQGLLHNLLTRGINGHGELRDPHRHSEQFKDSPLGRIPMEWKISRLGQLSPRLAGRLIVQPHRFFVSHGVPIVFGRDIREQRIQTAGLRQISPQADAAHAHCRIRAGDLLTIRVGVPGMTAVVPPDLDGCHFASMMWIQQSPECHSDWLSLYMNSQLIYRQILSANYGSVQTQFNISDAAHFIVVVPSLSEQEEVLARTKALTSQLETEQRRAAKLRTLKQGLMDDLLTGRVRVREKDAA